MAKKEEPKGFQTTKSGARRITISIPDNIWVEIEKKKKMGYASYQDVILESLRKSFPLEEKSQKT